MTNDIGQILEKMIMSEDIYTLEESQSIRTKLIQRISSKIDLNNVDAKDSIEKSDADILLSTLRDRDRQIFDKTNIILRSKENETKTDMNDMVAELLSLVNIDTPDTSELINRKVELDEKYTHPPLVPDEMSVGVNVISLDTIMNGG